MKPMARTGLRMVFANLGITLVTLSVPCCIEWGCGARSGIAWA